MRGNSRHDCLKEFGALKPDWMDAAEPPGNGLLSLATVDRESTFGVRIQRKSDRVVAGRQHDLLRIGSMILPQADAPRTGRGIVALSIDETERGQG